MSAPAIVFDYASGGGGRVAIVTLNRPKKLNALNEAMCVALQQQLQQWRYDAAIKSVIIKGAGSAFCAGGDICQLWHNRLAEAARAQPFFYHEYQLNRALFYFTKPIIALLDGYTLGGGVGLAQFTSHRVASERCQWAMPETGIGFFPDVAASYTLSRLPGYLGYYLGLTGVLVDALTAYDCQLVNAVVNSEQLGALEQELVAANYSGDDFNQVSQIIQHFVDQSATAKPLAPPLRQHAELIARCFSQPTLEQISEALQQASCSWSFKCQQDLAQKSPTSLKVTLRLLQRAAHMTFDQVIEQDLRLARQFLLLPDFAEGVRALLIDKDKKPRWSPATLAQVSTDQVDAFFTAQ